MGIHGQEYISWSIVWEFVSKWVDAIVHALTPTGWFYVGVLLLLWAIRGWVASIAISSSRNEYLLRLMLGRIHEIEVDVSNWSHREGLHGPRVHYVDGNEEYKR